MSAETGTETLTEDGKFILCDGPGCEQKVPNHYWGKVKDGESWFFQKSGDSWCPEHLPEWYPAWKEQQKAKQADARATARIVYEVKCDRCSSAHEVEVAEDGSHLPVTGWYMDLARVFPARTLRRQKQPVETGRTGPLFFCDKECAVEYLQFQAGTALTSSREVQPLPDHMKVTAP